MDNTYSFECNIATELYFQDMTDLPLPQVSLVGRRIWKRFQMARHE